MKLNFIKSLSLITLATAFIGCGDSSQSNLGPTGELNLDSVQNISGEWQLVSMNDEDVLDDNSVSLRVGEATCDGAIHVEVNKDGSMHFLNAPAGCFVNCVDSAAAYHHAVSSAVKSGALANIQDRIPYGNSLVVKHESSTFVFIRKP